MFPSRLLAFLLALIICLAQGRHPFDLLDVGLQDFGECLRRNNLSYEEYEAFESVDNLANLLNESQVELKYKCNIRCQLERQPPSAQWLDAGGRMDLQRMNATGETAASISRCMEEGLSDELCAYGFHLVMCAHKAGHPIIEYEEEYVEDVEDDYDIVSTEENGAEEGSY